MSLTPQTLTLVPLPSSLSLVCHMSMFIPSSTLPSFPLPFSPSSSFSLPSFQLLTRPPPPLPYLDVLHIDSRAARGHKFAFQVLATGNKFHFATKTAAEREQWITHLNNLLFGPPLPGIVCECGVGVCVCVWSGSVCVCVEWECVCEWECV